MNRTFRNLRCRVCLVWDTKNRGACTIGNASDAYNLAKEELGGADREVFLSILLATNNAVIGIDTVSVGIIDCCLVSPRDLFKSAILANSRSIVLMHNHPSGDCKPSSDDLRLTERIVSAGEILDIDVLDHIIVANGGFTSLREQALMRNTPRSILSAVNKAAST